MTSFKLDFMVEPPNAPSISILRKTRITLGREPLKAWALDSVYVSPERSKDQVEFSLDEIPADGPVLFAAGALASINRQIVEAMAKQGLGSIIVAPDEMDIGFTTGEDLREEGNTTLHLTIFLPTIKELHSFATGERVPENDATNNPVHSRILENSPVQAGETFWPNRVDDYVARLNRHPGRRVVAQLSPSYDREQLYLDYQITESKPWIAYAAISNSGAESTGIWQARIGMVHLQLTNRDDILSLDFVMNTNTDVRAVNLGYQLPLWIDTVRLEVDAGYADFEASSADAFPFISDFKGTQAHGGFNIAYNFLQIEEYFFDLRVGTTLEFIETKNSTRFAFDNAAEEERTTGNDNFLPVRLGLGVERKNRNLKLSVSTWADFYTLDHDTSDPQSDFNNLGRLEPDNHPIVFRWDAKLALFIDALLADPKNPAPISAHEFVMRYRGQSAFNKYRLIPHYQQIAGGADSVRGYEQGATAGDTVHLATLEYRLHVPRIFRPRPKTTQFPLIGEFAIAPRRPGERPDWDWVVKVFYDVASVRQSQRRDIEFNDVLQGVGVGTELFIKRNVQLRFDWGIGLEDARCNSASVPRCEIDKHEWEINFAANFFY